MQEVDGFEGYYLVSEEGDIFREGSSAPLVPHVNKQNGYLYVSLWKNNKGKTCSVHRIVAKAFIPNPDNKPEVNHNDSCRTNPHKDNLTWCTSSENSIHGYKYGYQTQVHRRILNEDILGVVLSDFLSGTTLTCIANQLGCSLTTLSKSLLRFTKDTNQEEIYSNELTKQKNNRNKEANKNKKLSISMFNDSGLLLNRFDSLTDATKFLGKKSSGTISNALNKTHPQKKAYGYVWKLT